ncbi:uncharacterized protein SCODWIG_01822 [Saccharomycodes ludwigii]|uniref:Protein THEM6 n=1 Tax=Saccharomycodes ludwigii TaxID=36035 RepID=A0A376B601_9ASCO|nr:hypothetical protein SCDLUD_000785 [Saccharomycodes ludwigii]KAH3903171.1 hypothetical protein SCDLUD_000785 [Saccharomycodes ludwigii]SSD60061.1 uncharacterized protein SCODWIG_01822 [Saccharomycodes ludwigii]
MIGKILIIIFAAINYKALPLAYYVRFYHTVLIALVIPYYSKGASNPLIKKLSDNKYGCFSHTIMNSYNSILETDMYLHKSNSTYFVDMDIARTELMSKIFNKIFMKMRKWPYVPVASITAVFKKEIRPLEKFRIESNILCWDEKWIYVVCKFYKHKDVLCTYGLTQYVIKDGRKTIYPKDALETCGLYNEEVAAISAKNLKILVEENGLTHPEKLISLEHRFERI